jgi:hypothetical protein
MIEHHLLHLGNLAIQSESRDLKLRITLGTILGQWEEPSKIWHPSLLGGLYLRSNLFRQKPDLPRLGHQNLFLLAVERTFTNSLQTFCVLGRLGGRGMHLQGHFNESNVTKCKCDIKLLQ